MPLAAQQQFQKQKQSDFEIKYIDNISGKNIRNAKTVKVINYNIAYVYVVAKDGTGYTGTKSVHNSRWNNHQRCCRLCSISLLKM